MNTRTDEINHNIYIDTNTYLRTSDDVRRAAIDFVGLLQTLMVSLLFYLMVAETKSHLCNQ